MKPRSISRIAASSAAIFFSASNATQADQTWSGATNDLWTTATNWTTTTPGASDVAIFNAGSTGNLTNRLGAGLSVLGISVVDPAAAVTVTHQLSTAAITANNTTDTLTYSVAPTLPLANGYIVTIGGTTAPTGLTAGTRYFVVNATTSTFQLSATAGGAAINFTTDGVSLTVTGGPTITTGASGINMSAATQNLTVNSPLALSASQAWNIAAGRTLTCNGGISGEFSLTKNGSGQLTLGNVSNGFTGGAFVNAGIILIGSGSSGSPANLGATGTTITLNGGTISNGTGGSNGAITLNNNFVVTADSVINMGNRFGLGGGATLRTVTGSSKLTINAGTTVSRDELTANFNSYAGTLSFGGSGNLRPTFVNGNFGGMTAAVVELNGTASLTPVGNSTGNTIGMGSLTGTAPAGIGIPSSGGTPTYSIGSLDTSTTYSGGIVGSNNITKVGAGTLTLTNTTALTYTGTTTVTGGSLKISGAKTGVGATTINSGGTLTGTGSLVGTTTVASGGILAPGDGGVGNITHSSLTLSSGGILDIDFGSGNDTATVSAGGTLTLSGGATVDVNSFATEGTYTIINTTGATVSGTATTALSAVGGDPSKVYTFADTGTAITMTISGSDPSNYWNVDGTGSWELAGNWTKNEIPNASGAIAKIGPGVGGVPVNEFSDLGFEITLDGDRTVGTLAIYDTTGTSVTIAPGLTTPGRLLFDNGVSASILAGIAGNHVINAPVVVDAQDLTVDVGFNTSVEPNTPYMMTLNGEVSGSGAAIVKSGSGILALMGTNSYDGGTTLAGGIVRIGALTSLGGTSAAATFTGGTLQLGAALTGDTRSLLVTGANNAIIDTNGFAYGYDGIIAPLGGGTGGLNKIGGGTLTLTAAQTYTGATNVTGGTLAIAGGSITAGVTASVTGAGLTVSSGSVAFNAGLNGNNGNPSSNIFINLTGGTFSASFLTMGRSAPTIANPTAGSTTAGLYVNGATASITGALNVGTNNTGTNSTASARIDSGSLTVDGAVLISIASPDRWSVFDVNGGTFTSSNVATGVQIGSGQAGSDAFLVRNTGVATVEKIQLIQPTASTETSLLNLSGGTLYVGSGGILGNNNGGSGELDVQLGAATLGAKASWSTLLGATLNDTTVIKAADVADAAFNISIAGAIGGTGGLQKTGAGTLTLSGVNVYEGTTLVSAGNLAVTGNSSGALGAVTVASGATLSGSGNLGGDVTVDSGAHHALAVAAVNTNQVPRVITGMLTMTSGSILDLSAVVTPAPGIYVLVTATGEITGTIASTTVNYNGINGTVAINGNNLELTVTGASGYADWASLNGASANANEDHDNDGVDNGVEYFIGGATGNTTGFTALPGVTTVGAVRSVNWTHAASYTGTYGTDFAVQTSATLELASWTNETLGGNVSIVGDNVTYTFPAGPVKNFVRLVVTP